MLKPVIRSPVRSVTRPPIAPIDRLNNTVVQLGQAVNANGQVWECVSPGTTGGAEPTVIAPFNTLELTTNGRLDTDTDWTKGTGTTISGGKANLVASGLLGVYQAMGLANDKAWLVEGALSNVSAGTLGILAGGTSSDYAVDGAILGSANGAFSVVLDTFGLVGANGLGLIGSDAGTAFTGSLDNISVKEVTLDGTCAWKTIG